MKGVTEGRPDPVFTARKARSSSDPASKAAAKSSAPAFNPTLLRAAWVFGLGFLALGVGLLAVMLAFAYPSPWVAVLPLGEGVVLTVFARFMSEVHRNPTRRESWILAGGILVPIVAFAAALALLH